MAQHARIEELPSDSDSDPPEDDLSDYDPAPALIRPSDIPPPTGIPASQFAERNRPSTSNHQTPRPPPSSSAPPPPEYKHYQTLYPLYFDAGRTRSEGRRVSTEHAVPNPLAREIVDAVQILGLRCVFEPGKCHPRDWSNPGRVRVLLKEGGRSRSARVKNKPHLYTLISTHLLAHPTTPQSPLRLRIQGMPPPSGPPPAPAVPRGWKVNSILPLHSPAVSGGGVSDNILKDVMQEMQGAGQGNGVDGGIGGMGALGGMFSGTGVGGGGGQGADGGKRRREGGGGKKR